MASLLSVFQQNFDNNGDPLSGGKIYTYEAGTTTPKATYTNSGAGTPLSNPVVLDSAGRTQIWGSGLYKLILKDSLDNTIQTLDNVPTSGLLADGDYGDVTVSSSGAVITIDADVVTNAKLANMAANTVKANATSGSDNPTDVALSTNQVLGRLSGNITAIPTSLTIQKVRTSYTAVASGTTTIPYDDTIPQITEGVEYMTQAITPTSTTSKLRITIVFFGTVGDVANSGTIALFQDATANALAAWGMTTTFTSQQPATTTCIYEMTAGTTSSTTFRVRAGATGSGTALTFNGSTTARRYGGVAGSSITVEELSL